MEDKDKDYLSFNHNRWCDLLSTREAKYNRKRSAAQIKRLTSSKAAPANFDINATAKVTHKNKESTGVLPPNK